MATFTIQFLVSRTNKGGETSWYWQPSAALARAGWKAEPLGKGGRPDAPPEAIADAARARNSKIAGWKSGGARPAAVRALALPQTFGALMRQFEVEGWPSVERPGYALAASTVRDYKSKFRTLAAWAGDAPLATITRARVAVLRDALMKPAKAGRRSGEVRHYAAHATLRVGRTLFAWAAQKGMVPRGANPFADFALAAPPPREQVWWAPAREALLAAAAPSPGMAAAIALAFATGQREADLLRLSIGQYVEIPAFKMDADVHAALAADAADGRVMGLRLRQSKGKRWIEMPVVGEVRAAVEAAIARARAAHVTTLLFDEDAGTPWTMPSLEAGQRRFIRAFAALRQATIDALKTAAGEGDAAADGLAGEIADLQFRDFRRTAVVYLGELGVADHLIAAITGHSLDETKRILDTYMPRTTGMAARAIALSRARSPQSGTLPREGEA